MATIKEKIKKRNKYNNDTMKLLYKKHAKIKAIEETYEKKLKTIIKKNRALGKF